ncbi:MAG: glucose 1-dehydrogenase [Betaproteobacteria bacterium]|nr:glucose 1-dehydrogenase [Betaproteobacteria bacterium]
MTSAFDLSDRVAVVTGGNGGIGLGMATGLAQAGATVMVCGRNPDKNRAAVAELKKLGARAESSIADVTSEADCKRLVEETVNRFGRLDVLVNNAGINIRKAPQDYSLEEWRQVIDTNLTSAFLCSKAAYGALRTGGRGKVINIGSMTSIFGASFAAPYSATKGGIVQLTRALATAWARDNIQVNAVLPGWIDTDLTVQSRVQVKGLNENVLSRTPAGRWGLPVDFAGIAVFLAAPASDFITGTAIPVDGGFSVQI